MSPAKASARAAPCGSHQVLLHAAAARRAGDTGPQGGGRGERLDQVLGYLGGGSVAVHPVAAQPRKSVGHLLIESGEHLVAPADLVAQGLRQRELVGLGLVRATHVHEPSVAVAQPDEEVGDVIAESSALCILRALGP